jgi:hypothetical protein
MEDLCINSNGADFFDLYQIFIIMFYAFYMPSKNPRKKGSQARNRWTVREINTNKRNEFTDTYLQYHPGTGRDGDQEYGKVSSGQ